MSTKVDRVCVWGVGWGGVGSGSLKHFVAFEPLQCVTARSVL